jgi:Fe-S cluster assembly scaffold protein SufB
MNRILVEKDKLVNLKNTNIIINNNEITFLSSEDYIIEYIDCHKINLTINLNPNITIKLLEYSDNQDITVNNTYNLDTSSVLILSKFYNNKQVEEQINLNLNNQYAKVDYHFSNICTKKEKYHIIINHNSKNTESTINNKSITTLNADLSFTIDSILPKGNKGCILDQQTRIITLEDSNAKIEPNMYIEEDDVSAKHGSVIGKFSSDELFYLMTRSIPENEARKLLIKGLILSNLLVDLDTRAKIFNIINEKWR